MALDGGAVVDALSDVIALFSETGGRFLVEVREADARAFEAVMDAAPCAWIGETGGAEMIVHGMDGQEALRIELELLKAAWQGVQS